MALSARIKRTDVGQIPSDWDAVPLRRLIASLDAGISVNSVGDDFALAGSDTWVLKTSCAMEGRFIPVECKKIALSDAKRAKLNPQKDSVLISRMNTPTLVGECAYVDRDHDNLFLPDRLWMTGHRKSDPVDVRWLAYRLAFGPVRQAIRDCATGTSGSMKNISKGAFLSICVPTPSDVLEQTAISEVLSDIDALIESLEHLLAKKRQIKQGAMQELLTGRRRLPGFSRAWTPFPLGALCSMASGGTPSTSIGGNYEGGIPWVSIADMTKAGKKIYATDRCLSRQGLQNSAAQMFPAGTVLYAMYASLGECSIAGIELCTSQAILGIQAGQDLDSDFLFYWLSSRRSKVRRMGQQGTQANLNKGMVQSFVLDLPDLSEQMAIAEVLSDIDLELAAIEAKVTKARQLKRGVMQELLTGRIRLV